VELWAWVCAHPAETAWIVFGALSTIVAVYRTQEKKIHTYVESTPNTADDKLVRFLDAVVAVFGVLRLLVPHLLGRPAAPTRESDEVEKP
jgi:hypothetical protein